MDQQLFDLLKWIIGVPAALVTFITIPYVIQKQRLELQKLRIELRQLKGAVEPTKPKKKFWLVAFFGWLAPYWVPICILQWGVLVGISIWKQNPAYGASGGGAAYVLFMLGMLINGLYGPFDLRRKS
ncbi:MAG: hypothetical protein M3362_00405 [Acidobacteriota bacterium]|nr:hypothetical protein [Acidobacteriota bacterium]